MLITFSIRLPFQLFFYFLYRFFIGFRSFYAGSGADAGAAAAGGGGAFLTLVLVMVAGWCLSKFYRSDASAYCSCCRRLNNFLSGWRLSPFYIALGVALLMWPNSLWLSSVVGIQLLILAILRLFTIFRYQSNTIKCESLLQKQPTNREYFEK